jgi:hypothetical protein
MEEVIFVASELRNFSWSNDFNHADSAISHFIKIKCFQSIRSESLLECTKVSVFDRLPHSILIDDRRLVHASSSLVVVVIVMISNDIVLMLLTNLSQRFMSSQLIQLILLSDFLHNILSSISDIHLTVNILFIVVAQDVVAIFILCHLIILGHAPSIIFNPTRMIYGIGIIFNTLASTAEYLNEEK